MIIIKNILNDVVANTYPDSPKLPEYQRFYVEMIKENRNSFHGDYHWEIHHIRIFNLYRDDNAIVATTIHELAHHVDYMNRGETDHGKEFYAVFRELLFTGLNMGIFTKDGFLVANKDASDSRKIAKMLEEYVPENISYKKDKLMIVVSNAYPIKNQLKEKKFIYNHVNNTWEKEITFTERVAEEEFLKNLDAKYHIQEPGIVNFLKKSVIIAQKGSFEEKENLKKEGFRYQRKSKDWRMELLDKAEAAKTLKFLRNKYPSVMFILQ